MSGIPNNGRSPQAPQQVHVIGPSPQPFTFQCDIGMVEGKPVLQFRFFTPTGLTVIFATPDDARSIANMIQDKAGGIVVPLPNIKGVG